MTTSTIELNASKRKLCAVLAEKEKDYFAHLKSWFRKRKTKDEFDAEARKLLPLSQAHLHNEFLLAILNKCQTLTTTFQASPTPASVASPPCGSSPMKPSVDDDRLKVGAVKRRSKSSRATFDHQFQPVNLSSVVPDLDEQQQLHRDGLCPESDRLVNCGCDARDGMMPDASMIQGRLLVAAWEEGLEGGGHTDPEVINLICLAAEQQIRSVIAALLMDKRGFRLRDGRIAHAVGVPAPNPWLRNSKRRRHADGTLERTSDAVEPVTLPLNGAIADPPFVPVARPSFQEAQHDSMVEVACGASSSQDNPIEPISLFDLMNTLQKHKRLIPSHSVYAVNLERLISRLYHKSGED